jgi:hypothetical protein
LPSAGDKDVGAFLDESLRDGLPDAAASAGDDGNLSVQSGHVCTFQVLLD